MSTLRQEFEYYLAHQEELVARYNGKFVAIKDGHVLGAFDSQQSAVDETKKSHPLGSFLVQKVAPGAAEYTQTYHSRFAVAQ